MATAKNNKTIYIRDLDLPYWDEAQRLAGGELSLIIIESLKEFIARKSQETREKAEQIVDYVLDTEPPKGQLDRKKLIDAAVKIIKS